MTKNFDISDFIFVSVIGIITDINFTKQVNQHISSGLVVKFGGKFEVVLNTDNLFLFYNYETEVIDKISIFPKAPGCSLWL